MELSKQCCTADQAMILQKLGISQESLFYWQMTPDARENIVDANYRNTIEKVLPGCNLFYSAFTVAELGVMLGPALQNHCFNGYLTEAQDRADELIHLIECDELSAFLCSDRLEA